MRVKMWHVALVMLCSGCTGVQISEVVIKGGRLECMEKPGLLGSEGLRVLGERARFEGGKCSLELDVADLPIHGKKWPYKLELRFFSSSSGKSEVLEAGLRRKIRVKYRVEGSMSQLVGSNSLSGAWIRTGRPLHTGKDYYYYPYPVIGGRNGVPPLFIKKGEVVHVGVDLQILGSADGELFASISMRTGGTK